jgi:hypothetical protein
MTMRNIMIMLGVVLLCVSLAGAQSSGVGSGNALDANPAVGSGGVNTQVQQQTPIDTNLYIYGQSTGLSGFRGSSFYAPNQLRLNLPGQSVRDFGGRSVGLQEVQTGYGLYQPTAYLDRAQTVVGLRGIEAGLNAPGSNVPGQSVVSPEIARNIYTQAVQRYEPITIARPAGQLLSDDPVQGPITQTVRLAQTQGPADRFMMPEYVSPDEAIFDAPYQQAQQQLLDEVRDMRNDYGAEFGPQDEEVVDPRVEPLDGQPEQALDPDAEPGDEPSTEMQNRPVRRDGAIPQPGQDGYYDLVMEMRLQHPEEADILLSDYEEAFRDNQESSLVSFDEVTGQYVIHALAGAASDDANRLMMTGQAKLLAGNFYNANADFVLASATSPINPLPQLGAATAMFAAGEPVTAARRLKHAMNMFPPTIETRLDLSVMLSDEALSTALADLDALIGPTADDDEPMLLLLATYMHASANHMDQARAYAQRLLDVAGNDEILSTYARFIVTGQPVEGLLRETLEARD